ncbi:hypothetical protein BX666DRAFT_2029363 [Dichotomocladium elegans]|nr:hypothetical protein BX666DRAFT_2029363 [Dichotomocladium elegans]
MWLEHQLKTIIENAANDFDETLDRDRFIPSQEDGTTRGELLDRVLASQKEQRKELWKKLHMLEDECRLGEYQPLYGRKEMPEAKLHKVLDHEEKALKKELEKELKAVDDVNRSDEPIGELEFKEQLSIHVDQLRQTLSFIQEELAETQGALARDKITLSESRQINEVLAKRYEEALQQGPSQLAGRAVFDDLMNFLREYYPPHPVDPNPDNAWMNDSEEHDTCEIKFIIEDLMNLQILNPENPYLTLQPGTFWSPYIETCVKAGIAIRHPKNPLKLRLVDFRLHT